MSGIGSTIDTYNIQGTSLGIYLRMLGSLLPGQIYVLCPSGVSVCCGPRTRIIHIHSLHYIHYILILILTPRTIYIRCMNGI